MNENLKESSTPVLEDSKNQTIEKLGQDLAPSVMQALMAAYDWAKGKEMTSREFKVKYEAWLKAPIGGM